MKQMLEQLSKNLDIELINTTIEATDRLNSNCGAEFVHKEVEFPSEADSVEKDKFAAFDGDADRLIYFFRDGSDKKPYVMDGDKQFALLMDYIVRLLNELKAPEGLSVLVNTAYANGKQNMFLDANQIHHEMVPTGVKNAHPVTSKFVIGANDEPNGHGTIQVKWTELNKALEGKEDTVACKKLKALLRMSNLAVGDAICNLLMVESVLRDKDMSTKQFFELYTDNPNKTLKAIVSDRTQFKTIWDETRLTQPQELQAAIDAYVKETDEGRAFVRPSGTEDILRVYVEAKTEDGVAFLAEKICGEIAANFKDYQA
jgi:phosphoacetylglucosamine mutase